MSISDAVQKQVELVPNFTVAPSSAGPIDPMSSLTFMSGQTINVSSRQVPISSPLTNLNQWRYIASGQYTNVITNGGQVQIKIDRGSGTGKCTGVPWFRLVVTNGNSGPSQFVPWPLAIQTMQLLTPDGTPIQNMDGSALWSNIIESYSDDSWTMVQQIVGSSPGYEQGNPVEPGVSIYFIPLPGMLFGASDFFLPCVDGDMMLNVNFWPASTTLTSGSNCSLTLFSLEVPMEQLDSDQLVLQRSKRLSMEMNYIYPYERIQRIVQNWSVNTTYPIPLNGIKGDVTMLRFYFRSSLVGEDLYHYQPISSFQIQDSAGRQISGAQYIDEKYNRNVQQQNWNLGSASAYRYNYMYVFGANNSGWMSVLLNGVKYGAYPFTTNETLQIITAKAGASETYTLTYSQPLGGGVTVTPSSGTFELVWHTPIDGSQRTLPIAYNASAAVVQAALDALVNFQGTVTVTTITNGWQFVMSGPYGNRVLYNDGYQLEVDTTGLHSSFTIGGTAVTDIPLQPSMNLIITQSGVDGITDGGSYILDIHAYTTSKLKQNSNRGLEVFNSG